MQSLTHVCHICQLQYSHNCRGLFKHHLVCLNLGMSWVLIPLQCLGVLLLVLVCLPGQRTLCRQLMYLMGHKVWFLQIWIYLKSTWYLVYEWMIIKSFTKFSFKWYVFPCNVYFTGPTVANNSCSSTESTPRAQAIAESTDKGNHNHPLRGEHFNSLELYSFFVEKFCYLSGCNSLTLVLIFFILEVK